MVIDSSIALAVLRREPLGTFDPAAAVGAVIGTVNLCEVLAKLRERGMPIDDIHELVKTLDLEVVDFDEEQCSAAAMLRAPTRHIGLSLGDRACIALGNLMSLPIYTTDRSWAAAPTSAPIHVVR